MLSDGGTVSPNPITEEIRKVCARMAVDLRGYRVVLFGSRAAGDARDRSDFDVGVLGDAPFC